MTHSLSCFTRLAIGKTFALALLLGAGTAAYTTAATALSLGEIDVKSHLGEPFLGYIAVKAEQSAVSDMCFGTESKPGAASDAIPYLQGIKVVAEDSKTGKRLSLTTPRPVNEPILKLLLVADCPGGKIGKEYTVLLDPASPTKAPAALPAAIVKATLIPDETKARGNTSERVVKPGDTLSGIAHDLFPWDTAKQKKMLKAIIAANPEAINPQKPSALVSGTKLHIPPLPQSKDSGPSPERGSTKPAKTAKSPSSRPAPAKQTTAKSHTPNEAKFQVKLASAEVSTKNIDKNAPQQQVKELITSTDDQTASVLALTNQVNHLENQLVQLQAQLSKLNIQLAQARSLPRPPVKAEQENGLPPTALALAALLFGALFTGVAMHYRERLIPKRFRTPQKDEPGPPHRATVGQKAQPQPPEPMPQGHAPAPHPDEDDARNIAGLSTSAISVAFSGSILDETNLYLSSGHTNKAITLLEEHLNESEDDIHVWIKLFELYAEQGAQDRFAALMPSFQQAFGGDLETQEKIRGIGRALDPDNPLYFAEEEKENLDFDQLAAEAPQMETGLAEIAPAIEEGAAISPPSPPISAAAEETVEPETPAVEPETAHSDDMLPLEIPLEFNIETQKEIKNSAMNSASLPPDDSTAEDASAINEEAPLELPPLEFSISPPEGAIPDGEPLSAPDEEAIALDALPKLLEEPDLPPLGKC